MCEHQIREPQYNKEQNPIKLREEKIIFGELSIALFVMKEIIEIQQKHRTWHPQTEDGV